MNSKSQMATLYCVLRAKKKNLHHLKRDIEVTSVTACPTTMYLFLTRLRSRPTIKEGADLALTFNDDNGIMSRM